jgi:hypothetical protein
MLVDFDDIVFPFRNETSVGVAHLTIHLNYYTANRIWQQNLNVSIVR